MNAADRLVLPRDLVIASPEALAPDLRERLGADAHDRIVTRPHSRARSLVVDANAAAFLEQFRSPSTVVDAVLRHAAASGEDPEEILEAAAPMLLRLRRQRLVAVEGEPDAAPIEPTLAEGTRLGGLEIVRCVHLFENVEVYRARGGSGDVALKILRDGASADSHEMLEREAAILGHLGGQCAPSLLSHGTSGSRPFLVQSWCDGAQAPRAAAAMRGSRPLPAELLTLCANIIRTYAGLHGRGVVHGDVHPGNIRVDGDGSVTLLDFGLSRCAAASHLPVPRRGGLADYFEPEYCAALMRGEAPPAATFASDQYSLAALVYLLVTGAPRQDFRLDRDAWLGQVAGGRPLPFTARGCPAWSALENVLGRALASEPEARFPRTRDFLRAFEEAVAEPPARAATHHSHAGFAGRVLARFVVPGDNVIEPIRAPRCSINFGAAGIAWFLYRLALLRGDARLLAAADVWCTQARAHAAESGAFASAEIGITPETVGETSPFHYESGLHLMQALVARAMGDPVRAAGATLAFINATTKATANPDLTLGTSSVLLGCCTLAEALPEQERGPVIELGERTAASIATWLASHDLGGADLSWYGIAHGWAGLLYALLRWSQATGSSLSPHARQTLDGLARLGRHSGDAIVWPVRTDDPAVVQTGWCHGSAGYVLLWTLADELLAGDYLALARGAANHLRTALGRDGNRNASLCCGYAGQAYALIALHRRTGERDLLDLAGQLCTHAIANAPNSNRPDSLYKGDVGIALLVEELGQPALACMPLVESERWARPEV